MKIGFSEEVSKSYFTLKAVPTQDWRQKTIYYEIKMRPDTRYSEGMDSFGNIQLIGSVDHSHLEFDYIIKGMVETQDTAMSGVVNESRDGMYKYPFGKCVAGKSITSFAKEISEEIGKLACDKEKCIRVMNRLSEVMVYEPGSTDIETTAEKAFTDKKGVCQDFAHIFITLLRYFGISARYVCGFIAGEGKSHAWVEAGCDGYYYALDPTHNREITDEYIKLGNGRDASDCTINKGVMWGGGTQTQTIDVIVDKYY